VDLSAEQIAGLAPDEATLKAGRGLASARPWSGLGRSDRALWGLCQGSASKPYQTQVDTAGPAFRCSCPSRKFPCKHALGLLLLAAGSAAAVPQAEPPPWVTEWLASREQRKQRTEARAEKSQTPDPEAQARRQAKREERVRAGLEDLERWLRDLVRQGLGQARQRPYSFWDEAAARLVDAQAGALGGRLQAMGGLAARGGDGWADALLEEAGLLQLLLRAYRRLDELPTELRADVRTLVGWTVAQDDVLAGGRVRDRWAVLGRVVEEEERLRVQRVWLRGMDSRRHALVLSFAAVGQPLDANLAVGSVVDASLAFYPSAAPLRALLAEQHGAPERLDAFPGDSIPEALSARADALARQPWLWRLPICLARVTPVEHDGQWLAAEPDGSAIALACHDLGGWRLAAVAGGEPVALFGEWRRERVVPMSVHAEGRFVLL
jgi:hypothetical protein